MPGPPSGRAARTGRLFTEIVEGDIRDPASVAAAMQGVDVAYYLIHSMGIQGRVRRRGPGCGPNICRCRAPGRSHADRASSVALVPARGSDDLASRQEVGRVLAASGIPTVEFRAGIVIGSGSLAFDAMRSLVRQLPIMIVPRWVGTLTLPIAIDDVIALIRPRRWTPPTTSTGSTICRPHRLLDLGQSHDRVRAPARLALDDHPRPRALAVVVEPGRAW